MKQKLHLNAFRHWLLLVALLTQSITVCSQERDELQEFVDNATASPQTRAGDEPTVIDLSAYTAPRTATLYIRNGANVKFINGTLKRATSLTNAPLVAISGNSKLEVTSGVVLSGNNFITNEQAIVQIEDGTFLLSGGSVVDNKSSIYVGQSISHKNNESVSQLSSGTVDWLVKDYGKCTISGDVNITFVSTLGDFLSLTSPLKNTILFYPYSDTCILKGKDYTITQSDCAKIGFWGKDTENYIPSLEGNSVYARIFSPILTLTNVVAGTLPELIPEAQRTLIEELTITGNLNGTDINLIRSMANNSLKKLDISECNIVKGGAEIQGGGITVEAVNGLSEEELLPDEPFPTHQGPDNVITEGMFGSLKVLETLILPNSVTAIYERAFSDCSNLKSITIGSATTQISSMCLFTGSDNLNSVELSNTQNFVIKDGILYDSNQKTVICALPYVGDDISFPSSVDSISSYAFYDCQNVKNVYLHSNIERIGKYAFCRTSVTSIELPVKLTRVAEGAFWANSKLKSVTFTEQIDSIEIGAFAYCDLPSLDLSMTKIRVLPGNNTYYSSAPTPTPWNYSCFEGNEDLTEVSLPATLEIIGRNVFSSEKLADIYCHSAIPPNVYFVHMIVVDPLEPPVPPVVIVGGGIKYDSSFPKVDTLTCRVHVPRGSLAAYKVAHGWKAFFRNMTEDLPGADPNFIESEDELQKRLDEIAEENPSEPVTLTICEEGVTLIKGIRVRSGCKVIITGGRIATLSHDGGVILPTYAFSIEEGADITFSNITLDLSDWVCDWYFENWGDLTYDNVDFITGGPLNIYGDYNIYGYNKLPILYLRNAPFMYHPEETYKPSSIRLLSSMQDTWIIDGNWDEYDVNEPCTIVSGYNYAVTKDDYSRMQFVNLPDDMETSYDETNHVVVLRKKIDVLQCIIDGGTDCTADGNVPLEEGTTDIGCENSDDPLQCAVDATIDGQNHPTGRIAVCCCDIFPNGIPSVRILRIHRGSSLTLRYVDFEANKGEEQYIYVSGTLIIDIDVYIRRFHRFIHIMPGGHVIWRGGHTEDVDEVIYNEGGTVEIEGGTFGGRITNLGGGTINITGGTFNGGIENYGTLTIHGGGGGVIIRGNGGSGIINRSGGNITITGNVTITHDGDSGSSGTIYDIENHGENGILRIEDGVTIGINGGGSIWSETDIWLGGDVKVTDIHIKKGVRIHIISKLTVIWRIHFFVIDEFEVYNVFISGGDGYKLTDEDFENTRVELPDGYRWVFHDGGIVIVRIPFDVVTIVEYLNYFGPQGTLDKPWSFVYNTTNITIDVDWHILRDYHLIFDGGQFTMDGGDIYIDEGASLWINNIRFKGTGRHIYVYGTLYIDENIDFADIVKFVHLYKGGRIIMKSRLISKLHIVIDTAKANDRLEISGLTKADLEWLTLILPDDLVWQWDETRQVIVVTTKEMVGITTLTADKADANQPVYNVKGQRATKLVRGQMYVRRGKKFVAE